MKEKMSLKKKILLMLFIAFNIAIIGATAYTEFVSGREAEDFSNVEIRWAMIFPAILCFLLAYFIEGLKYAVICRHNTGKFDFKSSLQTVIIGRYYDNVTPSGIGGQPSQIFYLKSRGYSVSESSAIPLAGFMSTQFGFIILALSSFTFGHFYREVMSGTISDIVVYMGYVGLFFFSITPTVILLSTFFPNATTSLIVFFIRIGRKLHLVRKEEELINKTKENVSGYCSYLKKTVKDAGIMTVIILMSLAFQILIMSIPYFVVHAFGGEIGYIQCVVTAVSIQSAITFIPTPGNEGVAEGAFYSVFSSLTPGYTFWAMLLWRFFSFYIFVISGPLIHLKDYIRKKHRK